MTCRYETHPHFYVSFDGHQCNTNSAIHAARGAMLCLYSSNNAGNVLSGGILAFLRVFEAYKREEPIWLLMLLLPVRESGQSAEVSSSGSSII